MNLDDLERIGRNNLKSVTLRPEVALALVAVAKAGLLATTGEHLCTHGALTRTLRHLKAALKGAQ